MESLSEFWKNIKERISNPLVFSFILAWLVYNWEITLGLFFMDSNDIRIAGHPTLLDYVKAKSGKENGILIPFLVAFAYCLIIPISKEFIRSFNALVAKYGSRSYYWISKGSKIDFDLFLRQVKETEAYKKEIDEQLEFYVQEVEKMKEVAIQNEKLTKDFADTADKYATELATNKITRSVSNLNGDWFMTIIGTQNNPTQLNVSIRDGKWIEQFSGPPEEHEIVLYFFNKATKEHFFKRKPKNEEKAIIFYLKETAPKILIGKADQFQVQLTYR